MPCEDCGATARRSVGQHVRDGRLGWDAEFWCPACGTAMCLGFGTRGAPRWVRDPLIDRHGTVRLRLAAPAADRVAALRTVRAVRDLPLPRSLALVRQLTDAGLPGTPAEAE
ncbi:hypothetical protein [Streptomyces sp. TLI_171]|uniref:hypothetical protein n=1 Tax=Streptomyces sp. TLI_171 TaxID=1938859 RepID=UPI000C181497|nr:hypothetical protein [Streptomyces sp. TLI_171]RKE18415.1 hypothetical protein BX266_1705 [Streptomyces sp. TLI_171]